MNLSFASAVELAAAIRARKISATEALDHVLERIHRFNPAVNAIVTLDEEGARRRAREADEAISRGDPAGPLHGVPITLKDAHATAGMRTTAGYPPLADWIPSEDSTVAARLRAAGANLLGKTNVPALLLQPLTDNPIFGRTNNPWDLDRSPGGSSGGAAAALAAGLTYLEIGSDMAGSIRMPAHFCGVFGLKPTTRRISMAGHVPALPGYPRIDRFLAVSGPMARSLDDLRLGFRLLAGEDGRDTEVAPVPVIEPPVPALRDLRVAVAPVFPGTPAARPIREAVEGLARRLQQAGARVEEALPDVNFEEQRALWARMFRWFSYVVRNVWNADVPGRTRPSEPPSALDLVDMARLRDELIWKWGRFFESWDVLLCPPAVCAAFPHAPLGTPVDVDGESVSYGRINHFCFPSNVTGNPAIVLPAGQNGEGLPIGVQLVGARWEDERLLAAAESMAEYTAPFVPPPGY
jgi:amidase